MKIKELEKTVNLAWSPKSQVPILLAAGPTAQSEASIDPSDSLELYSLNLGDSSYDLDLLSSSPSEHRFHSLAWESYDSDKSVIVGGCDDGRLVFYDAARLLRNENGFIGCKKNHTGAVRALDFNPFQKYLLASGASKSQLIIWDLNKLDEQFPLFDTALSQPGDDIISLSWNKQVERILAATFSSKCVIWDVKKNELITTLTDSGNKIRWKDVTWNPQVAYQLCLASEEDQCPVIQLWDLRSTKCPMRTLQGHQKGVLSVAWCDEDPELLVSCGKDNKLLVWNMRTDSQNGDVSYEMPLSSQWNFEIKWCPRNPFLVSISSAVDRRASVYSLCGGRPVVHTSNKIPDSFPGINNYPDFLLPEQLQQQQRPVNELRRPPKWMKKPVGVSFAFGGKLISFDGNEKTVYVSQVVTEPELMYGFKELLAALEQNNIFDHCYKKAEQANDPHAKDVWNMIATQFYGEAFRNQACSLLGTTDLSLNEKLRSLNIENVAIKNDATINDQCPERIGPADGDDIFDILASRQRSSSLEPSQNLTSGFQNLKKPLLIIPQDDVEGAICDALLLDNKELAVNLCIKQGRMADALALASKGGPELILKTQMKYFENTDNYLTTLISAVVNEDWCNVVETCDLSNWKHVLVALINHTKDDEFRALCELLGERLLLESENSLKKNALICFVCAGNINQLLHNWSLINRNIDVDAQELVDVGLVMKEAMKSRGININISGCLAKALVQYAELLASQGYLTAAFTFLGETSDEENVKMLRDRLTCALGLPSSSQNKQGTSSVQCSRNFPPSVPSAAHSSYPSAFGNSPITFPYSNDPSKLAKPPINEVPLLPSVTSKPQTFPVHKPMSSQIVSPTPLTDSVNQPFSTFPTNHRNPSYPPMANSFQPQPSFQQGPIPPTSAPNARAASHLFDPSGTSQFGLYNKPPSTPAMPPPSVTPTAVRSTPTPPAPPLSSQGPYNNLRQTPDHIIGQSRSKYVVDPSVLGGPGNRGSYSSNFQTFPSALNAPLMNPVPSFSSHDTSMYQGMPNQNAAYETSPPKAKSYIPNSNVLTPSLQPNVSNHIPGNVSMNSQTNMSNRIMSPSSAPQMQILQPTTQLPSQKPRTTQVLPTASAWNDPPPFFFEKPISSSQPPMNVTVNSYQNDGIPSGAVRTPDEMLTKSKPALPEQHIHLQTVFEELRNQCVNKTANQQMKRKLDDVARKLEMLYDGVRENKLSPQALSSLHKITNAVQQGNYQACLSLYTELVSGPDFATIASFMPGIKVLVQSALQLDVYI